ncbi:zinc metalloproteinase nas-15-like [Oculina patagonica]
MFLFVLLFVLCSDFTCSIPWREAVNENDNPKGLKDNTIIDRIEEANEEDHTEQKVKNIFEADIELTKSDSEGVDTKDFTSKDTADVDVDSVVSKRRAIASRRLLWVTKEVPVELGRSAGYAQTNIIKAIDEIQKKSCIRFRMKKRGDRHWIRFVKKIGCFSPVGRQYDKPGMQELSVGAGCNSKGIIMHELMHALGFWHEQSRTDRDDYLEVLWENVKKGQEHNFNRYKPEQQDPTGSSYDFSSIMHYGNYAFSKNKRPTMLSVKDPMLQFGQIAKLSSTDILQLNSIYDCKSDKSRGWSNWGNWSPCDRKCARKRERFCSAKDLKKCPGATVRNRVEVQRGKCRSQECYAPVQGHWGRWGPWSKCSRTCGQGYSQRSRQCDDPKPLYGGKFCRGAFVEVKPCQLKRTCGW